MFKHLAVCLSLLVGLATQAGPHLGPEQKQLVALLAKASPGSHPTIIPRHETDFSPYLTDFENRRLVELLRNPAVANAVTRDQVLAVVIQRHRDNSLADFQYNAVMDLLNRTWSNDPVVVAFYREALHDRPEAAISDLFSPLPGPWDDSLIEPIIRMMEKNASSVALTYKEGNSHQMSWDTIGRSLAVLERHYDSWATNASIPPRLSSVVLTVFPALTNQSLSAPRPGQQMWCNAVRMLAQTRDRKMIAVLRPFLKTRTIAGDGSYWITDGTPLRACDITAMAVMQLLGDINHRSEPIGWGGKTSFSTDQPFQPKWDEWDKKIAKLNSRIRAEKTSDSPSKP